MILDSTQQCFFNFLVSELRKFEHTVCSFYFLFHASGPEECQAKHTACTLGSQTLNASDINHFQTYNM